MADRLRLLSILSNRPALEQRLVVFDQVASEALAHSPEALTFVGTHLVAEVTEVQSMVERLLRSQLEGAAEETR